MRDLPRTSSCLRLFTYTGQKFMTAFNAIP
jgi:hypothetical protein